MKLKILLILLIIFGAGLEASGEEIVKIGLLDDVQRALVGSRGGIEIIGDNVANIDLSGEEYYYFTKAGDEISFSDKGLALDSLVIHPNDFNSPIYVNGLRYKGYIEILNRPQGLTVINHVNFDDYLSSVVGSEVISSWPMEALKAQVVVARTYALRNINSHLSRGYNLSATVRSQAYKGVGVTNQRTARAVEETKGEVVVYEGDLIAAVYHSAAGGQTASGESVWGSLTPYLQSVPSNDKWSPNYNWKEIYSKEEIENILRSRGIAIENLYKIVLEDKGLSNRPRTIGIYCSKGGYYSLRSNDFRVWLGLRSTKFTIKRDNSMRLNIPLDRFSFDLGRLDRGIAFNLDGKGDYSFVGNGWGHGVGMSQWGAYGMATEGYKYEDILAHYYQGVEIINR